MGKQKEELRDVEKAWLEEQYKRADVQAILTGRTSGSFLRDAAQLLYADYVQTFADPLPEETQESFLRRVKNARKADKSKMFVKPAEQLEDVAVRLDKRCLSIKKWIKRRHRKEKAKAAKEPAAPPVPPLTPRRRPRGVGGLDVFAQSPLRQEILPATGGQWQGPGAYRHHLAQAFRALAPDVQAQFIAQAQEQNAQRTAEALEEAGSAQELVRGLKVGNVHEWFEEVMAHLRSEVQWVGAVLLGGPDETGNIRMLNASNALDPTGQDFWGALSQAVGWQRNTLMRFSVNWFERAFSAPVPPPDFNEAEAPGVQATGAEAQPGLQATGAEELVNASDLQGTPFGDPGWSFEANGNVEDPVPPPVFDLPGVPAVQAARAEDLANASEPGATVFGASRWVFDAPVNDDQNPFVDPLPAPAVLAHTSDDLPSAYLPAQSENLGDATTTRVGSVPLLESAPPAPAAEAGIAPAPAALLPHQASIAPAPVALLPHQEGIAPAHAAHIPDEASIATAHAALLPDEASIATAGLPASGAVDREESRAPPQPLAGANTPCGGDALQELPFLHNAPADTVDQPSADAVDPLGGKKSKRTKKSAPTKTQKEVENVPSATGPRGTKRAAPAPVDAVEADNSERGMRTRQRTSEGLKAHGYGAVMTLAERAHAARRVAAEEAAAEKAGKRKGALVIEAAVKNVKNTKRRKV